MTPDLLTLDDLPNEALDGQAVLVRVDFNVPMDGERITDPSRIEAALPTVRELRQRGARIVLASHRGRPEGAADPNLSLRPIADALEQLTGQHGLQGASVAFSSEAVGAKAKQAVAALSAGSILMLENLRFYPGEKACDEEFSDQLRELAAVYVSDAFGAVHRAHASTTGVASKARHRAAGRLIENEVAQLGRLLDQPGRPLERPYLAMLGGAKVSGKIDTLLELVERIDILLLGGGLANTFLVAQGRDLGGSLVERDRVEVASRILARCRERGVEVVLPRDLVVTRDLGAEPASHETLEPEVPLCAGQAAVDLGPRTIEKFSQRIASARTLFWNGPLGVFEQPPFDRASLALAHAVANCAGFTVLGGGETGAVAEAASVAERVGHVSTGGGASLAFLAGKTLPGLLAVSR